jgi:hypothetical protein
MQGMRHAHTTVVRKFKWNTPNLGGTIILKLLLNVAKALQWRVLVNAGINHRLSIKDGEVHD